MRHNYSIMRIKLDGADMYILWFSDIQDGVYTYNNGNIPVFNDSESLKKFCDDQDISVSSDELIYCNLDMVRGWLENPTEYGIKYDDFFHVWNILHDILLSIGELQEMENSYPYYYFLYDKLFWGAMIESKGKDHSAYYQDWDEDEILSLQGIFKRGIDYFREYGLCKNLTSR